MSESSPYRLAASLADAITQLQSLLSGNVTSAERQQIEMLMKHCHELAGVLEVADVPMGQKKEAMEAANLVLAALVENGLILR